MRVRSAGPNPEALAGLIHALPQHAAQILATIATSYGNTTVQKTQALSRHATGKVTASVLNVRSTPARGDNVVGTLHRDEAVEPLGQTGPWLQVPHGQQHGFVWSGWVELEGKAPPAQDPAAHAETQPHQKEDATPAAPPTAAATPAVATAPAHAETADKPPEAKPVAATPPAPPVVATVTAHADTPPPVTAPIVPPTTTPAVVTTTPPTTTPASATPHAIIHPGAATFETIQHTRVEVNQDDEGKALSDIRAYKQQFDPQWLIQVQQKLQVGDATGAFNTETLRAIRDTEGKKLSGKQISDHAFLVGLGTKLGVTGDPYRPIVDAEGHDTADHTKTDPADLAAQSIGYADYHTYRTTALKKVTFLDVSLEQGKSDGRAHPLLRSRIEAAEAYLVNRFGSKQAAIQKTGWSKNAGAAYSATDSAAHDPQDPKSHMHTMGMAIDIDPNVNPYTMPKGDGADADWIYWFYVTGFELGHRLGFGGDALDLTSLLNEGQTMSSEELHDHMLASSKSFAQAVELSEKSDEDIKKAMLAGNPPYKEGNGDKDIQHLIDKWFHPAKKIFHDQKTGDRKFHETMTESKELVVALRDAGGLNWGGTEMSAGQNGDFMHFDTRNDDLGHKVYKAGYDAQKARKEKLAAEAKAAKPHDANGPAKK